MKKTIKNKEKKRKNKNWNTPQPHHDSTQSQYHPSPCNQGYFPPVLLPEAMAKIKGKSPGPSTTRGFFPWFCQRSVVKLKGKPPSIFHDTASQVNSQDHEKEKWSFPLWFSTKKGNLREVKYKISIVEERQIFCLFQFVHSNRMICKCINIYILPFQFDLYT